MSAARTLLAPGEPAPLERINPEGASPFVLVCEHAGRRIPRALGTLGLSEADLCRHIAWDIGAREVAVALAGLLDAPLFAQRYSRLVCDCNRRPAAADFIPAVSDTTEIPANTDLDPAERAARIEAIFRPFHDAIAEELDRRQRGGVPTLLVTIHSFTPVFKGLARPWHIGVLFNRDRRFAPRIVELLKERDDLCVGVNQPYATSDENDYAIPVHGERRGLPCAEFEIRNDLIGDPQAVARRAALIAEVVREAAAEVAGTAASR